MNLNTHFCKLLILLSLLFIYSAHANDLILSEKLRERIETAQCGYPLTVKNKALHSQQQLIQFYNNRTYQLAWSQNDQLTPQSGKLLETLPSAEQQGLDVNNYAWSAINELIGQLQNNPSETARADLLVDLDLLLSDAFLTYGKHLLQGKANPQATQPHWGAQKRELDLQQLLADAITNNKVSETLLGLQQKHDGYQGLLKTLAEYRQIQSQGGWQHVTPGAKLQKGQTNARVAELKKRLVTTKELPPETNVENKLFDQALADAIKAFQRRHGLKADGVAGASTIVALNISVEERIGQLLANLERWRWLPAELGQRHIMVNIPTYELVFVDNNKPLLKMPVIVGKTDRETPIFSGNMTYLVVNPYWHVPKNIASKDKLPLLMRDSSYLQRHNMKLYKGHGANAVEINPGSVDWSSINAGNFPYRIVQQPGTGNPLGKVKFMLPNGYDVYLHDTSEPRLFAKTERTFSSGCVRIRDPKTLATYVIENNAKYNQEGLMKLFDQDEKKTVYLKQPIPVHIAYWTAWIDETGAVNFRKDIYGQDQRVLQSLLHSSKSIPAPIISAKKD